MLVFFVWKKKRLVQIRNIYACFFVNSVFTFIYSFFFSISKLFCCGVLGRKIFYDKTFFTVTKNPIDFKLKKLYSQFCFVRNFCVFFSTVLMTINCFLIITVAMPTMKFYFSRLWFMKRCEDSRWCSSCNLTLFQILQKNSLQNFVCSDQKQLCTILFQKWSFLYSEKVLFWINLN